MIHSGHNRAVDWWSLGALMFDMLTGAVSHRLYHSYRCGAGGHELLAVVSRFSGKSCQLIVMKFRIFDSVVQGTVNWALGYSRIVVLCLFDDFLLSRAEPVLLNLSQQFWFCRGFKFYQNMKIMVTFRQLLEAIETS